VNNQYPLIVNKKEIYRNSDIYYNLLSKNNQLSLFSNLFGAFSLQSTSSTYYTATTYCIIINMPAELHLDWDAFSKIIISLIVMV